MPRKITLDLPNMLTFVVVAIAILLLVPLDPAVQLGDFEPTPYTGKINTSSSLDYIVEDHYFPTQEKGVDCHAWLYLPLHSSSSSNNSSQIEDESSSESVESSAVTETTLANRQLPIIIMASGFAEQKDFGLDVYAERFVQYGFAVFLFDYRSFGASQGVPRNWVSPKRHIQDWNAAIDYISETEQLHLQINPQKIGLWGMSFGGGHVLTVVSQRHADNTNSTKNNIVAVVAQAPFLRPASSNKKLSKRRGQLGKMRLAVAALQDAARGYLGLSPAVIPILGLRGQLSMMPTTPEALDYYLSLHPSPKLGGWINRAPVRGLLEFKGYKPLENVRRQPPRIPVLLISGSRDAVCPAEVIDEVDRLLPHSSVITRNASHVELMGPDHAPSVSEDMAIFFAKAFQ